MKSRIDEEDCFRTQVHLLNRHAVNSYTRLEAVNSLLKMYSPIAYKLVLSMASSRALESVDLELVANNSLFDFYFRYFSIAPCKLNSHADAKTILMVIVRNRLLNSVREINRLKRTPKHGMEEGSGLGLNQFASRRSSASEEYEVVELQEILGIQLNNTLLNETFEKLCLGHDASQIADQVGCSRRTVERRINQIRIRLKIWDAINCKQQITKFRTTP